MHSNLLRYFLLCLAVCVCSVRTQRYAQNCYDRIQGGMPPLTRHAKSLGGYSSGEEVYNKNKESIQKVDGEYRPHCQYMQSADVVAVYRTTSTSGDKECVYVGERQINCYAKSPSSGSSSGGSSSSSSSSSQDKKYLGVDRSFTRFLQSVSIWG